MLRLLFESLLNLSYYYLVPVELPCYKTSSLCYFDLRRRNLFQY